MTRFSFSNLNLKQKIIGYFTAIFVVSVAIVLVIAVGLSNYSLSNEFSKKARVVTSNLSLACADPLAAMAYAMDSSMSSDADRLNQSFKDIQRGDKDVIYLALMDKTGKCVASTSTDFMGKVLDKSDYEKGLLSATSTELRQNPDGGGIVDVTAPVMAAGQKIGVLRIGF